jgi:hypothetical protein
MEGNLEMAMHHKDMCEQHGGTVHMAQGQCHHSHPHINGGAMYECGGTMMYESKQGDNKKPCPPMSHIKKMCQDGKSVSEICKMHPDCDHAELKQMVADCKKKMDEASMPMKKVNGKSVPAFAADGKGKNDLSQEKNVKETVAADMYEAERTMSRAAKGMMKYGKEGMKALAKAGKEGKDLDKVRDKYDKYDEATEPKDLPKRGDKMGREGNAFGKAVRDAKAAGEKTMTVAGKTMPVKEAGKPSAGMSKEAKSALAKKAHAGGDIGKPGKSFDKVAKAAGGGEKGKKIAAAAMWKNAHESVELQPVNESADLARLKELTQKLLG